LSGSTLVSIIMVGDNIYCANVGDSRAIMCKYINDKYEFISMS